MSAHAGDGEPTRTYLTGDGDPTPDRAPFCRAPRPLAPGQSVACTWPPNHVGYHVAGDGKKVVAVWAQDDIALPLEAEDAEATNAEEIGYAGGARAMRIIYQALIAEGFTDAQAVHLTAAAVMAVGG